MKNSIIALFTMSLILGSCNWEHRKINKGYVERNECKSCHEEEFASHKGSHHDLAMDEATPWTVLGDFEDAEFIHGTDTAHFYREADNYFVRAQNEHGIPQTFPIAYTFGWTPLQQYLIEFPGGKYQVLPYCWDSRLKEEGGQRWYHIYGDEHIPHNDPLYWTGKHQNWNHVCAECHSTNFRKNYDNNKLSYNSSWSEIDVSCDACHGPSKDHLKWANLNAKGKPVDKYPNRGYNFSFQVRDSIKWVFDMEKGTAFSNDDPEGVSEIEVCARCHSRRYQIWDEYEYGQSIHQTHIPEVLEPELYYPDGQIKDEVYVYGSFLQSKMYKRGVSCTDCHDPHSMKVEAPDNVLCAKCHVFPKYNNRTHHFHNPDSTGGNCRECHMPRTTYMGVDRRLDHSIRIPRPDLSLAIGSPNACTQCHTEESDEWAAQWFRKWYGRKYDKETHYGEIFHAATQYDPEAFEALMDIASGKSYNDIVRATAIRHMEFYPSARTLDVIKSFTEDPSPMVRRVAVRSLSRLNGEYAADAILKSMKDEQRSVRFEAYQGYARLPVAMQQSLPGKDQKAFMDEYMKMLLSNADQAASYTNLGVLYQTRNRADSAEISYRKALEVDSTSLEAGVNLADLYRSKRDEKTSFELLQDQLRLNPHRAEVYHALGMWYTRQKKPDTAIQLFETAVEKAPENTYYLYVYSVALHSMDRKRQAEQVLQKAYAINPNDYNILNMLCAVYNELGDRKQYARYYEELQQLSAE